MSAVWMKDGVEAIQKQGLAGISNLKVHLFKNNHTPAKADGTGNYTEADFTGYSPQAVGGFGTQTWDATNLQSLMTAGQATFVSTGSAVTNSVYGAYLTGDTFAGTQMLLAAELFLAGPFSVNTAGQQIQYTPVHSERSQSG